jgi:peptidoglycan/xylan/chitin deacetylase (PgdA/CDA1 family)
MKVVRRTGSLLIFVFLLQLSASCNAQVKKTPEDKEIVCFVYHRVGDSRYPSTNTTIKDFEAHLDYLAKNNFTVLSFSQALKYLSNDETAKKVAVITIDDGYSSFFKNGFPLLKKYRMPATLFINTKTVGGGDYMGWRELATVMKHDVEIGNHTHSHDFFLNQPEAKRYTVFEEEIKLSQELIKKNLGTAPEIFSFPYGEFDLRMKKIVIDAGFNAAAAQKSGVWYEGMDLFQCPRFPMSEAYSPIAKFREKAVMRPLRMSVIEPETYIKPAADRPLLTLTFDPTDLRMDQLQCFVQGAKCNIKIVDPNKATVTIQAAQSIAGRRRTLYTLTVPDRNGRWHWYSHLWINPTVKE